MAREATNPPWKDELAETEIPRLKRDLTCEVCVIGAGIAGLTTAYELAQSDRRVILIDPNPFPGGGETRATSAHLSSVIDDRFEEVARIRGLDATRLAYESHAAAIDRIEAICHAEDISCGFRRVDGILFPARGDEKMIAREYEAASAIGCPVEMLREMPRPALCDGPCLKFPRQAAFEPSRYMAGLWSAAARRGVIFYGNTRATEVKGGSPVLVRTDHGDAIHADRVVVATNSPSHTRVALHTKLAAYSTYAITVTIPRGSVPDSLFWDTLEPYHYVRLITSRDRSDLPLDTDLLLVGGADHKTGQETNPAQRWDDLEAWTRSRFPQAQATVDVWSGMVMETLDGLAYIGADPSGEKNVYVVAGDSGMGLTHGTIAAGLLKDLILDRPSPLIALYEPSRLPIRATGRYLSSSANVAAQYKDWLTSGDVKSEEAIEKGTGAIVRHGLSKLAVYRDDDGKLTSLSAVCPHLGGLVRWNPAEKTWDCPCHGSRFRATGEAIHGPAHCGLSRAED